MTGAVQQDRGESRRSRVWSVVLAAYLRGAPSPLMRFAWRRNPALPFGELVVVGRRTGQERRLLVNVIEVDGRRYVGHPNGNAQWTRNLAAAGVCTLVDRSGGGERVGVSELSDGPERDAVLAATTHLPAPTGRIYRAAGEHIRAVGRYFELVAPPNG
jgi:hypothetical protein